MPSIDWTPKGPRIKALVEDFGLRAPTVLFLDDNASNRGEALAFLPDIQVEDERFAAFLLDDPRFAGKSDPEMSRLAQYKVLEAKRQDQRAAGDNRAFLKDSGIVVEFEYDVEPNIDRAIELITRTNQLNFTKRSLPQEIEEARDQLQKKMSPFYRQAALIRVRDRYGD